MRRIVRCLMSVSLSVRAAIGTIAPALRSSLGLLLLTGTIVCWTAIGRAADGAPSSAPGGLPAPEISVDVWDWTRPAQDLVVFEQWARDLKEHGCTRLELSVAWKTLEPSPGVIDLTWLRQRHTICRRIGIPMRLRMNTHHSRACPDWYAGDLWKDSTGTTVTAHIPSICDENFWKSYGAVCTAVAQELTGEDVLYSPFFGLHAELKYGNWWTWDDSSLGLWRSVIAVPRPEWLRRVVDDSVPLPAVPSVPAPTAGVPDLSPESRAFIAFREWTLRRALERFQAAIRAGDPAARISAPLGESYRRESALMSNLDYWGLSRGCVQVVHSYDFFIHSAATPLWHVTATIRSFQGITGLPVVFEFDAPERLEASGFHEAEQRELAQTVRAAGAGLKFANSSYGAGLPSAWPIVAEAARLVARETVAAEHPTSSPRALLFFSKWANYSYREPTEWLHEAQFGWWKLLTDSGWNPRIICEDNLAEDLSGYDLLVEAFSPPEVLPQHVRDALAALPVVRIRDFAALPIMRPDKEFQLMGTGQSLRAVPTPQFASLSEPSDNEGSTSDTSNRQVILGFPLGYYYGRGDQDQECRSVLDRCLGVLGAPDSSGSVHRGGGSGAPAAIRTRDL